MDLLAGDLAPEEEDSLRAAIEGCDECGPEFEMMALLMDFSGPALRVTAPKEIDAVVMAAAKEHVGQLSADSRKADPGVWARLAEWLESFAIGPQFAMATVMVLVVAVGFWYVPKHESHEVAGTTVVLSDPEGEAVAADDPGAISALVGAGETERVAEEFDEIERASNNERDPEPVDTLVETAVVRPPTNVVAQTMRERPTGNRVPRRAPQPAREQSVRTETDMAMTRAVTRMSVSNGRVIANQGTDDVEDLQQQSAAWAQELEGVPMPSYSDEAPRAPTVAGGVVPPQALGAAEASETPPLSADAEQVPAPRTSPSRALLQLARNHRAQARCDQAVRHYESLLARFSSSPEVPAALMESADCYRRMGRISDAERALRRALQFASTRTNARRELTRLETIRAAQRETSAPSSAPDNFESAY